TCRARAAPGRRPSAAGRRARAQAGARALRDPAPGSGGGGRPALRIGRGGRASPAERARRAGEGGLRAGGGGIGRLKAAARSSGRVKRSVQAADKPVMGNTAVSPAVQRPDEPAEPAAERPANGLYPPRKSGRSSRMIGEVAVDLGFADRETVEEAVLAARSQGRPTGTVLVERGVLRHDQLARVVAERFGLDFVDLAAYDLDMGAVNLVSAETARRYQSVPVGFTDDGSLLLA